MDPFERVKRAVTGAISLASRSGQSSLASKRAETALERGDFGEAEDLLKNVVADLEGQPSAKSRYAKALLMLASAQWRQQKTAEARENAATARPMLADSKQSAELAECLDLLGTIALQADDPAAAARLFGEALDVLEKSRRPDSANPTDLHRRHSTALRKTADFEGAKKALEQAIRCTEKQHGADSLQMAECMLELGQCESARSKVDAAVEALERGLQIYETKSGRDSDEVVDTLRRLAAVCQDGGELEKAVGYYERALQVRERQLGGKSGDFSSLLVDLGSLHSMLGRFGPAIETLQQAVLRLESARDERLGTALDALGSTYFQYGRIEDAAQCVRRARKIWTAEPGRYEDELRSNGELMRDVAEYLPEERRLALGFDPALYPPASEGSRRRRRRTPWDATGTPPLPATQAPAFDNPPPLASMVAIPGLPGFPHPEFAPEAYPPERVLDVPTALAPMVAIPGLSNAPFPPGAARAPSNGHGVTVTFVRPDGTALEPGASHDYPSRVTVVLGDGKTVETARVTELNGWDDLAFDFLETPLAAPGR